MHVYIHDICTSMLYSGRLRKYINNWLNDKPKHLYGGICPCSCVSFSLCMVNG